MSDADRGQIVEIAAGSAETTLEVASRDAARTEQVRSGSPALLCEGLRYRFGDHIAVDGIDLRVERGEIFGLLGPNGAGKTTTIRVVNTLLPVQEGRVDVLGYDIRKAKMAVRRRLGYVPQQLSIEAALTGRQNVTWFARLFDVPRAVRKERVADALEVMGLTDAADRLAGTYSGGMVRRLELAQALVNRPQFLVLDEPTVGLDPVARDGVWQRVAELQEATGMTVLLTTHYMEEADLLCDRVALLHLGRVQAVGAPEELKLELGPDATLEDVFRHHTGNDLVERAEAKRTIRAIRTTRRTAGRVG
jgi:ABC-2 type transport system ATP-binding protein